MGEAMTDASLLAQLERELYGPPPPPSAAEVAQAEAELRKVRAEVADADPKTRNLRALREAGIRYEYQVRQSQAIIRLSTRRVFDFWPTTGRWRERAMQLCRQSMAWNRPAKQEGHGVESLLAAIGAER
jgi:hypothetical protein